MVTLSPTELVLADAYRDAFQQAALEAAGVRDSGAAAAILALVREAERQCPTRDAVYQTTKAEWEAVMRLDAVTGQAIRRTSVPPAADPQARLL